MSYSSRENGETVSEKRQRVHIHMDKELKKQIDQEATKHGMNRSEYVCNVLERSLISRDRYVIVEAQ